MLRVTLRDAFFNPDFFPLELDLDAGALVFVPMTQESYLKSSFLDQRIVAADPQARIAVDFETLIAAHVNLVQEAKVPKFLFHTAFCSSTLITRALDSTGRFFCLREPWALQQLSMMKRVGDERWRRMLPPLLLMLSKTYGEKLAVIKPVETCNNLIEDLEHFGTHGVFLYSGLRDFMAASLKSELRRRWTRGKLEFLRRDFDDLGLPSSAELPDAQVAALYWTLQMRHLSRVSSPAIQPLDHLEFVNAPAQAIARISSQFGLILSETEVSRGTDAEVLEAYSKDVSVRYDQRSRDLEKRQVARDFAGEIEEGVSWALEKFPELATPSLK